MFKHHYHANYNIHRKGACLKYDILYHSKLKAHRSGSKLTLFHQASQEFLHIQAAIQYPLLSKKQGHDSLLHYEGPDPQQELFQSSARKPTQPTNSENPPINSKQYKSTTHLPKMKNKQSFVKKKKQNTLKKSTKLYCKHPFNHLYRKFPNIPFN